MFVHDMRRHFAIDVTLWKFCLWHVIQAWQLHIGHQYFSIICAINWFWQVNSTQLNWHDNDLAWWYACCHFRAVFASIVLFSYVYSGTPYGHDNILKHCCWSPRVGTCYIAYSDKINMNTHITSILHNHSELRVLHDCFSVDIMLHAKSMSLFLEDMCV